MSEDKAKTAVNSVWKPIGLFVGGAIVGSALTLGGLFAWQDIQKRSVVQIKLPSSNNAMSTRSAFPTPKTRSTPDIPPPPNLPITTPSPLVSIPAISTNTSKQPQSPTSTPAAQERIKFEIGTTGTTLKNSLKANQSTRYLLECRKGQRITVNLQEGNINLEVLAPDGSKLGSIVKESKQWEGELPSDGDYTIEISTPKESNYSVKVEDL